MSEPKDFRGTPGEWRYATGPAFGGARYHTVEGPEQHMVCECSEGTEEEQEANARLHAASKDLLAALQEILNYDGGADNALEDEYVMERADAAIARATEVGS